MITRHFWVLGEHLEVQYIGLIIQAEHGQIVRDYAPSLTTKTEAIAGFREVRDAGEHCRFANCQHLREPNCAVKQAVDDGSIDARRYESYRRSLALIDRLSHGRH